MLKEDIIKKISTEFELSSLQVKKLKNDKRVDEFIEKGVFDAINFSHLKMDIYYDYLFWI